MTNLPETVFSPNVSELSHLLPGPLALLPPRLDTQNGLSPEIEDSIFNLVSYQLYLLNNSGCDHQKRWFLHHSTPHLPISHDSPDGGLTPLSNLDILTD